MEAVQEYRLVMAEHLAGKRQAQTLGWFDDLLREAVWRSFLGGQDARKLQATRAGVLAGELTPVQGVVGLLSGT